MGFLCYDYALQYLARYPKTSFELGKQLQKKGYEQEDISLTIEKLEMSGFLDDALYADMYLRSEVIRKGKPLFKVQQKLYQKGVDKDVVSGLLDEHEDELLTGQQEKIKKEIHRWRERGLEDQKIMQKLQSRGYGYRDIQSVYDMSEFS